MLHQDRRDRRAQTAAGAIAAHRAAGSRHRERNSGHVRFPRERADSNSAGACVAPEFPHRRNPASPGKAMPRVHRVGAGVQALAALSTACLEHLAATRRRHTYAKAVRLAPVALLGLVRPLDGRLSETLIASGALEAPLSPTGLLREYIKATADHPSFRKSCRDEITGRWCARSACDRGCALLDSPGCSGSGSPSLRLKKPPGHQRPCIYPLMCTSCG